MKLVREKSIRVIFNSFVSSPDGSRLALWCSSKVTVLSFPSLEVLEIIAVPKPEAVCFLSDNCSLLIQNERGVLRLWQNGSLQKRKVKAPGMLYPSPVPFEGGDSFFFTGNDIWRFDLATEKLTQIFSATRPMRLCECADGHLRIFLWPKRRYDTKKQKLGLVELLPDGTIVRKFQTSPLTLPPHPVFYPAYDPSGHYLICCDAPLLEDEPPLSPLTPIISYSFGPDGKAVLNNEDQYNDYLERMQKRKRLTERRIALYTLRSDGSLEKKRFESTQYARADQLCCGSGLVARCFDSDLGINFYDSNTLELLFRLEKGDYSASDADNYPQLIHFCSDGRFILSTMYSLIIFRIEE